MMVSRRGGNRIARDWLAPRIYVNGARGGNRTHTALRPPDFESGASASSATRASDAEERLARGAASLNRRIFQGMRWDLLVAETKEQARRLRIHSRGRTRVKRLRFD